MKAKFERSAYWLASGPRSQLILLAFLLPVTIGVSADEPPGGRVEFSRDIRPLLSDKCFRCHGPDKEHREADLRLDTEEGAFADLGGYKAILRGDAEKSELYKRIVSKNAEDLMPPPDSGKTLTPQEISLIKRWIDEGGQWQGHWAFITPSRPPLPKVSNAAWIKNEIDYFILAHLEALGWEPLPEADRRTLIRRVSFDLTGMPPTSEEVEAFVADKGKNAYENVVDRLLQSPRYGEHMARYWLDAARYGDTHGLHLDNLRVMWPYRDWVIRAFNKNIPFDRFTIEQLAGDLLPDSTLEQKIASGFNRCNVTTSEGGAIDEEFYVRYAVDRVETTATVWMGLTAGCAVCHEHKFDPLTMKEFYQLFAYFNNITERAMDGNAPAPPPFVKVPLPGVEEEKRELLEQILALQAKQEESKKAAEPEFLTWVERSSRKESQDIEPPTGLLVHFPMDGEGKQVVNAVDSKAVGSLEGKTARVPGRFGRAFRVEDRFVDVGNLGDFEWNQGFSYGCWVKTPGNITGTPIARMDTGNKFRGWDLYVTNRRVAMHLIHAWSDRALKVTTKEDVLEPNKWQHVFVTYDGSGKATGARLYVDGQEKPYSIDVDNLAEGSTRTDVPLYLGQRRTDSRFQGGEVDEVRIYDHRLEAQEVATLAGVDPIGPILATPADKRTAAQVETLRNHYLLNIDRRYKALGSEVETLRQRERELGKQVATTLVMEERKTPRGAYILERGQYDQRREQVKAATPAFLPPPPKDAPADRLGFARWLVDPAHPLTARVTVNRIWQEKFGTGIVKTSEDFGSQGEPPSHPQLLDWLSTEFVRSGWDVKALNKKMVMSAAYRQSSRFDAERVRVDPENRLLARGPRFRLDAEMLRDQALAVSGLLVNKVGGPSVKPPQPSGLWYAVGYTGSNTVRFKQDSGDSIYRRSLYTFWKRTAPPPAMSTLDAPSRESCSVRRERTNTPLQALLLLNDVQYVEAARHLAQLTLHHGGKAPAERAGWMFRRVTSRPATSEELQDILVAYQEHLAEFRQAPESAKALIAVGDSASDSSLDPVDLAAWTLVGNIILNLDEVISKG